MKNRKSKRRGHVFTTLCQDIPNRFSILGNSGSQASRQSEQKSPRSLFHWFLLIIFIFEQWPSGRDGSISSWNWIDRHDQG